MAVFPEEILEQIFAYLEPARGSASRGVRFDDHIQRTTLASICKASKACSRIAFPYLYSNIQITAFSSEPRLLLRSLLKNSRLTLAVRTLRISGHAARHRRPSKDLGNQAEDVFDNDSRSLACRTLESMPFSTDMRTYLLERIVSNREDCEIACVAAICPFLELLDLPAFKLPFHAPLMNAMHELYGPKSQYRISRRRLAHGRTRTAPDQAGKDQDCIDPNAIDRYPFSEAHDVSIDGRFDLREIEIGEVFPLFYLPKLKTLHMKNIKIWSDRRLHPVPKDSSCLQVLTITDFIVHGANLAPLLMVCSNLHTLSIRGEFIRCDTRRGFGEIGQAINRYGTNLHALTLITSVCRTESVQYPLGDVRNLRSLRELQVTPIALFGVSYLNFSKVHIHMESIVDLLPTSLERLYIFAHISNSEMPDFSPAILELWMDHRFANLQQVSLDRLAWTEKLLDMPLWESSDSTATHVVLKRPVYYGEDSHVT